MKYMVHDCNTCPNSLDFFFIISFVLANSDPSIGPVLQRCLKSTHSGFKISYGVITPTATAFMSRGQLMPGHTDWSS
jgi:hypothetical protein